MLVFFGQQRRDFQLEMHSTALDCAVRKFTYITQRKEDQSAQAMSSRFSHFYAIVRHLATITLEIMRVVL